MTLFLFHAVTGSRGRQRFGSFENVIGMGCVPVCMPARVIGLGTRSIGKKKYSVLHKQIEKSSLGNNPG